MTQTVHGYAARDTGGHLSPFSFKRRDQMMTYGGYSEQITVTENFVLRIPEKPGNTVAEIKFSLYQPALPLLAVCSNK